MIDEGDATARESQKGVTERKSRLFLNKVLEVVIVQILHERPLGREIE